jgi:hypothetical protein
MPENLNTEDLEKVTGGALWFDALEASRSAKRKRDKKAAVAADSTDKPAEDKGVVSGTISGLVHGAGQVKERLDMFGKH